MYLNVCGCSFAENTKTHFCEERIREKENAWEIGCFHWVVTRAIWGAIFPWLFCDFCIYLICCIDEELFCEEIINFLCPYNYYELYENNLFFVSKQGRGSPRPSKSRYYYRYLLFIMKLKKRDLNLRQASPNLWFGRKGTVYLFVEGWAPSKVLSPRPKSHNILWLFFTCCLPNTVFDNRND